MLNAQLSPNICKQQKHPEIWIEKRWFRFVVSTIGIQKRERHLKIEKGRNIIRQAALRKVA